MHQPDHRFLGGVLLVSGTAIGAGMLALPVSTGLAGLIPSIVLFVCCWVFMTYTAFLMLEVNLWEERESNLISMAKHTLGRWGEIVSWVTYLFLLYALTTAYVAGSGTIIVAIFKTLTGVTVPSWVGSIPLLLLFSLFVYKGTSAVDHVNRVLMAGLILTYGLIVIFVTPHVNLELFGWIRWPSVLASISLVVTSFGFHIIIPTLTTYLRRDILHLKKVILIGSTIPLLIYIIWEMLVLGTIPIEGAGGLAEGYVLGIDGAQLLSNTLQHPIIGLIALLFSFCAIITSFLGVSLSLSDFLADGLHIQKSRMGKTMLYLFTFAPPLVFALLNPRAFFSALEYAGAFGVMLLLALLPALMVWKGRYVMGIKGEYRAPGGKGTLIGVIVISLSIMVLELINKLG